jgi:hypothetical protein
MVALAYHPSPSARNLRSCSGAENIHAVQHMVKQQAIDAAKALGLTRPPSFVLRAAEVE